MTNYEHYAFQLTCINKLKDSGLISKEEYEEFKKYIQKKYKIVFTFDVA